MEKSFSPSASPVPVTPYPSTPAAWNTAWSLLNWIPGDGREELPLPWEWRAAARSMSASSGPQNSG